MTPSFCRTLIGLAASLLFAGPAWPQEQSRDLTPNPGAVSKPERRPVGPAGPISRRNRDVRLDAESVVFANGIRLNVKQTDFERDVVFVHLRFGRGAMAEPIGRPGLRLLLADYFQIMNEGQQDEFSLLMQVGEDAYTFTGSCRPDRLIDLLTRLAGQFKLREFKGKEQERRFWDFVLPELMRSRRMVSEPLIREPVDQLRFYGPALVLGDDHRYRIPTAAQRATLEGEELKDWIFTTLSQASVEIGVCGDVEPDRAIDAVARTLGVLPKRSGVVGNGPEQRPVAARYPLRQLFELTETEPDKAAVHVYWPGVDDDSLQEARRLRVLAQILNDRLRLKIRNELGATATPLYGVWGSNTWPGIGYCFVEIATTPQRADRVAEIIRRTAADLATKGITDEEFSQAIAPIRAAVDQQLRSNRYWGINVLAQLQAKPRRAEWPLTCVAAFETMTRPEVEALAKRILGGRLVHTFVAKPK